MEDLRAMQTAMARDDWEDWTDDETVVANKRHNHPGPLVQLGSTIQKPSSQQTSRRSKSRQSAPKIQRLKSRKRQKFQNEKLGIRLVTDMTRFRKGPHHVAQLVRPEPAPVPSETAVKFVDASALRALEGSPSSASMGNWAWFKTNRSPATATATQSPDGSKIVIGISMPEQDAASRTISPQTATVATPMDRLPSQPTWNHQPASTWSPDTEDGFSPGRYLQGQPSIYAQSTGQSSIPPVPAVPPTFSKNPTKTRLCKVEDDDDDDDDFFTPVTLFEEDGRKDSPTSAISKISPETTRSRSGWWDHVKTPFRERFSPTAKSAKEATSPDEWWKGSDEKKTRNMAQQQDAASEVSSSSTLRPIVPIIRQPSPTMASSSRATSSTEKPQPQEETQPEKARVVMDEGDEDLTEMPPPYERTPSSKQAEPIRYRAVFPAGHHLASQFPPTPQPDRPGPDGKMSSSSSSSNKCAAMMLDVPLTPARTGAESAEEPLPDRVAGTYVGDQFAEVAGDSPAAKVEKTRRRHEKEDYLAHKAGGFWKGRGCIPEDGCYGRSGREGRQRRRVWLWVCLAFWLLTILGVVLGVVLSRKLHNASQAGSATASGSSSSSSSSANSGSGSNHSNTSGKASSVWLNLTNFPAIPTGLATVVGPDNSAAISGCVAPATLWSCSLAPEQQAANEPSKADQPMFIFQIQYDNNTRELWNIPNGNAPTPSTSSTASTASATTSTAASASASATTTATTTTTTTTKTQAELAKLGFISRRDDTTLYDTGIAPNPSPPSYEEMWFLGNWTDGIVSANKSGEPTPFYISFFHSLNDSAGANLLPDSTTTKAKTRRGGIGSGSSGSLSNTLPAPIINADGTGSAAQLRPFPLQQPLRLFDRGLDTEHYGFYSYFNKTIYVSTLDNTSTVTSSNEGGVLEASASWYVTWTQTRFIVKIWTRKTGSNGSARLIGSSGASSSSNTTSPGSFPYPITIGEDTHGGDLQLKKSFAYGVEADQHINTTEAATFTNNIGYGSAVVNAAFPDGDLSWGGTDGGTGGCKCEWVNWVNNDGTVDTSLG